MGLRPWWSPPPVRTIAGTLIPQGTAPAVTTNADVSLRRKIDPVQNTTVALPGTPRLQRARSVGQRVAGNPTSAPYLTLPWNYRRHTSMARAEKQHCRSRSARPGSALPETFWFAANAGLRMTCHHRGSANGHARSCGPWTHAETATPCEFPRQRSLMAPGKLTTSPSTFPPRGTALPISIVS